MKVLAPSLLLLLLSSLSSFSQNSRNNKKDTSQIIKAEYVRFNLDHDGTNKRMMKVPFQRILVHDVRFDTTFIGLHWQFDLFTVRNQKFDLTDGFRNGLTAYLNMAFKNNFSDNGTEVICYIKKFSLSGKDTLLEHIRLNESIIEVKFEAECYYSANNSLYPATRLDTIFSERSQKIKISFVPLLKQIITPLEEKLSRIDSLNVIKRRPYSKEEIENRYKDRFNVPILTCSKYVTGLYANAQEFKNNAPSIKEVRVKQVSTTTFHFADGKNNVISPFTIFGFSDGKKCWIQSGNRSLALIKVGNSFEFYYPIYDPSRYGRTVKLLFALDMDD